MPGLHQFARRTRWFLAVSFASACVAAPLFQQSGSLLLMSNANVTLQYDLTSGQTAFYWRNTRIISAFYSGAGLSSGYIKGTNYTSGPGPPSAPTRSSSPPRATAIPP